MTATAKFRVGDIVRAKEYDYTASVGTGTTIQVTEVDTSGRYASYKGVVRDSSDYRSEVGRQISYFTGGKYEFVSHEEPPPPPKSFEELTKEELAKRVVEVSKKYARQHNWCAVVDKALQEIGLGDYITVTKTVTVEVEVPATATTQQIIDAAEMRLDQATVR